MKKLFYISTILIWAISCHKEYPPPYELTFDDSVTNITDSSALIKVFVISKNGDPITEVGIKPNTGGINPSPYSSLNVSGGVYEFQLDNLTAAHNYSFISYVISEGILRYGNDIEFTTLSSGTPPPTFGDTLTIASSVSDITFTSVKITVDYSLVNSSQTITKVGTSSPTSNLVHQSNVTQSTGTIVYTINNLSFDSTYTYVPYVMINGNAYYGDSISFSTNDPGFEIGPAGGYIFYSDGNGGGLEVSPVTFSAYWGCAGTNVPGTLDDLEAGLSNTDSIVMYCSDQNSAAQKCLDFSFGGYTDWHLPSHAELTAIWIYVHYPAPELFPGYEFLSSSQVDANTVKGRNLTTGNLFFADKNINLQVAPIRSF